MGDSAAQKVVRERVLSDDPRLRSRSVSRLKDIGGFAYWCFFWLGLGNLFPWNAFITSTPYFSMEFCGTAYEFNFLNYFAISFQLSQMVGLVLSIKYQHLVPLVKRIYIPLVIYCVIFFFTSLFVVVHMDSNLLFFITLLSTWICGLCGAFLTGALYGYGAVFPAKYTGALMSGQSLGGLTVSLASFLTIVAHTGNDGCDDVDDGTCEYYIDYSALTFFILSTIILASAIAVFAILESLPFSKFYHERSILVIDDTEEANGNQPLLMTTTLEEEDEEDERESRPTLNKKDADPNIATMADVIRISKQMKSPAIAVWLVFAVTIGLFPALTALIESTEKCKASDRFHNDLFLPFMFIVFNLFDLVGRLFAKYPLFFTADNIAMASAARLIFFPLFMLCNIADSNLPTLFTSDAWPVLFMTAFAFTNGYFASLSMMYGPSKVPLQDQQLSGTVMVCYLTLGLMTGAAIGFVVVAIVQG